MKFASAFLLAVFPLLSPAAHAAPSTGNAAFLFAYQPEEGQEEKFEAGYHRHLEWHRKNRDPLPWYGWYVSTGDRIGMFVDGSFGIAFSAFDNRIKPAEDGANFAATTAPHGDTAYRKVLRLMPQLGTAVRLEERKPSARIEVVTIVVRPGKTTTFESLLEKIATGANPDPKSEFTVYRQLAGSIQPSYLLMFPRDGYAYFETGSASVDALIETHFEGKAEGELMRMLAESVKSARSETWRYRKDLSYFPAD